MNRYVLYLIALLQLTNLAAAESVVKMCSETYEKMTFEDGSGYVWDTIRKSFALQGYNLLSENVPFNRCMKLVELDKEFDGMAAAFKRPDRLKKFHYTDIEISNSQFGLVFLSGNPVPQLSDLYDKVAIVRGYNYSTWLPSKAIGVEINSPLAGLKLLDLGRIEYLAEELWEIDHVIDQNDLDKRKFSSTTYHVDQIYSLFPKNTRGKHLATQLSLGLKKLIRAGEIKTIADQYGLPERMLPVLPSSDQ